MANYFDLDDIIRRAANGEFGDPGVGGGGDEFGGYGVGGDADEFGAYAGVGNWALALQRSPAAMAQNLARKAQAGRLSKSDIAAILQMLGNRCAPPVAPGYGVPFPGFGGPVGPGKGSTGVAIGIGTGTGTAATALAVITQNNPREPMRLKRILIQAVSIINVTSQAGKNAGVVTAITVAGFPLVSGGNIGVSVFDMDNESPLEFNQVWPSGTPLNVNITTGAGAATQTYTVTALCAAL